MHNLYCTLYTVYCTLYCTLHCTLHCTLKDMLEEERVARQARKDLQKEKCPGPARSTDYRGILVALIMDPFS